MVSEALQEVPWSARPPPAPSSGTRKAAAYRVCEMAVTTEKRSYRAIVVHSDAGDKRRQKKPRALAQRIAGAGRRDPESGREDGVLLPRGRRSRRREAARRLALPLLRVRGQRAADLRAGQAAEKRRAPGGED